MAEEVYYVPIREGRPEELLQSDQPRADVMPRGGLGLDNLDISDEILDSEGATRGKTNVAAGKVPCSISLITLLLLLHI